MGYFQIIRADGSSKRYSSMIRMLQNIDREDLETLWKLVKTKHGLTRPEESYERVLWGDLKVFEPDLEKKRYPLTSATITEMLNKKLQTDHGNEMCYQLLKLMTKTAQESWKIKRLHDDLGVNTAKRDLGHNSHVSCIPHYLYLLFTSRHDPWSNPRRNLQEGFQTVTGAAPRSLVIHATDRKRLLLTAPRPRCEVGKSFLLAAAKLRQRARTHYGPRIARGGSVRTADDSLATRHYHAYSNLERRSTRDDTLELDRRTRPAQAVSESPYASEFLNAYLLGFKGTEGVRRDSLDDIEKWVCG
ncbi:hypothetical protein Tco_0300440 [Tanacetum coccineum]